MLADTSCGRGKVVDLLQKDRMHQENKGDFSQTIKIGMRTVHALLKNWKDRGEPSSKREKCGPSGHTENLQKMNATLAGDKCCDIVEGY